MKIMQFWCVAALLGAACHLTAKEATGSSPAIPLPADIGPLMASGLKGIYTKPPKLVPTGKMTDGPVLGNGDLGVVIGGPADHLTFYLGKSDFFGVIKGGMAAVGSLKLDCPELKDASSYLMEQKIGPAQVTGSFSTTDGCKLSFTSWVANPENLLVVSLKNVGGKPLSLSSQLLDGLGTSGNAATRRVSGDVVSLLASPDILDLELGNRLCGLGKEKPGDGANAEHAFTGEIADFRLYDRSLTIQQLGSPESTTAPYFRWSPGMEAKISGAVELKPQAPHGGSALFSGAQADDVWLGALLVPQRQWSISVWLRPTRVSQGIVMVATACLNQNQPRAHGIRLSLLNGKPSIALNRMVITSPVEIPLNEWTQIAATYDGSTLTLLADGKNVAETNKFPSYEQVMGAESQSIHFGDPKLPYQGCSTQGLMALRAVAGHSDRKPETGAQGVALTLQPNEEATLAVAIVTDRNDASYASTAVRLVKDLDAGKLAELSEKHERFWHSFWEKSFVEVPDKAIEANWYGSLYLLACCSRADCPPPGLWGNFVTVPEIAWNGDYTLNYNYEAPFWAAYATNHMELADNYEKPLLDFMPRGRAIAEKNHEKGLYYPMHLIPMPGWSADGAGFLGQKCETLFACVNCIMRWRYTCDLAYAKKIYPFLKGAADFWDNHLVLKEGRYVDLDDAAGENKKNDNPATSLAFLRLLYPALIEISGELRVDQDRVDQWKDILAKLSPLPIVPAAGVDQMETACSPSATPPPAGQKKTSDPKLTLLDILGAEVVKNRTVIRNGETGWGFPFPMVNVYKDRHERQSGPGMSSSQTIFPGWAIGLESSEAERKAALDTITLTAHWYDFNEQCSFYPGAACAGYDPAEILTNLHELIARQTHPNFMIHAGGGGTENFAVTPAALAAMFLQSYQTNIHLFPDWPGDQDACFGNLNACGGFLISSARKQGCVQYVQIESLSGKECRLANPWPGGKVNVSSGIRPPETLAGPVLKISTKPGEVIQIVPAS